MKSVTVEIESISAMQQRRYYVVDKLNKESHAEYEKRTWREAMHYDERGLCYIPPMAWPKALVAVCKLLGEKIKGKGQATWTKQINGQILVVEGSTLYDGEGSPYQKDKVLGTMVFVPSDGVAGGGSRVEKIFPTFPKWKCSVNFTILNDAVPKDLFERYLIEAGNMVGIGVFRPANGGYNGRFKPTKFKWSE